MISEKDIYEWCVEQAGNLIHGTLAMNKIRKLSKTEFDWNRYIKDYLELVEQNKVEWVGNELIFPSLTEYKGGLK
tara:strand:+ start:250 stop:474 length:225 start_codon:yes stop_codon:yes gene_type:complete